MGMIHSVRPRSSVRSVPLLVLKKGTDGRRTITSTVRYGNDLEETVLERDATGFISAGGTRREADDRDARAHILSFLESQDEPIDEKCIGEGVEARRSTLVEALRGLVRDNAVERCGAGKRGSPYRYALPGKMPVPAVPAYIPEPEKRNTKTDQIPHDDGCLSRSHDWGRSQSSGNLNPHNEGHDPPHTRADGAESSELLAYAQEPLGASDSPIHETLDL